MARKLSRIARCGILTVLTGAMTTLAARASAETEVRATSTENVIENPFAVPRERAAPPRPIVVPTTDGEPKNYQNPFAERGAAPQMRLRVPRIGSSRQWRRPLPASNPPNTSWPGATVDRNVRPVADEWDTLSPSDFRDAEPALFDTSNTPSPITAGVPPEPTLYSPHALKQPPWLLPKVPRDSDSETLRDESRRDKTPRDETPRDQVQPASKLFETPVHADRSASRLPRSPAVEQPQSFDGPRFDPFEQTPSPAKIAGVSEPKAIRSAAYPATADDESTPPEDGRNSGAFYVAAQQAAEAANSPAELSDVVQLCQQGLARRPRRELADSLQSLAAWACNRRGELLSDAGKDHAAVAEFDTAIEFDPNCWLALHNRAISRAQQGRAEPALHDFNRAIQLNPGLASAYRNRGELLAAIGRTEEAIADYSRAMAQIPDDAELYDIRGHALHRLGRYQEAINDFDRSIELDADNAESYTHRGNVFAELNDFERAVDDLEQALSIDAECGGAYRSLAWLMATCPDPRFRDPQQAVAAAEEAARLSPRGDPFVLDALAAAYASAGQYEPAVRYQIEAIAIAPESFAAQFGTRLALYRQSRPFRNNASGAVSDDEVRAASLESPSRRSAVRLAH